MKRSYVFQLVFLAFSTSLDQFDKETMHNTSLFLVYSRLIGSLGILILLCAIFLPRGKNYATNSPFLIFYSLSLGTTLVELVWNGEGQSKIKRLWFSIIQMTITTLFYICYFWITRKIFLGYESKWFLLLMFALKESVMDMFLLENQKKIQKPQLSAIKIAFLNNVFAAAGIFFFFTLAHFISRLQLLLSPFWEKKLVMGFFVLLTKLLLRYYGTRCLIENTIATTCYEEQGYLIERDKSNREERREEERREEERRGEERGKGREEGEHGSGTTKENNALEQGISNMEKDKDIEVEMREEREKGEEGRGRNSILYFAAGRRNLQNYYLLLYLMQGYYFLISIIFDGSIYFYSSGLVFDVLFLMINIFFDDFFNFLIFDIFDGFRKVEEGRQNWILPPPEDQNLIHWMDSVRSTIKYASKFRPLQKYFSLSSSKYYAIYLPVSYVRTRDLSTNSLQSHLASMVHSQNNFAVFDDSMCETATTMRLESAQNLITAKNYFLMSLWKVLMRDGEEKYRQNYFHHFFFIKKYYHQDFQYQNLWRTFAFIEDPIDSFSFLLFSPSLPSSPTLPFSRSSTLSPLSPSVSSRINALSFLGLSSFYYWEPSASLEEGSQLLLPEDSTPLIASSCPRRESQEEEGMEEGEEAREGEEREERRKRGEESGKENEREAEELSVRSLFSSESAAFLRQMRKQLCEGEEGNSSFTFLTQKFIDVASRSSFEISRDALHYSTLYFLMKLFYQNLMYFQMQQNWMVFSSWIHQNLMILVKITILLSCRWCSQWLLSRVSSYPTQALRTTEKALPAIPWSRFFFQTSLVLIAFVFDLSFR